MSYEAVIGLEVHAELQTRSKMFCACPVVDATSAPPNSAVCPVCAGMPGVLPVVNQRAVELGLRVALALNCRIAPASLFARKNYFYPDLPKGYQISQYEYPLSEHGQLAIDTCQGERVIRIRRVHLEEDTGKLSHVRTEDGDSYSLVDLNRAGVPLLEIVSEPDMRNVEEARLYATNLRSILRYVGASSGDMEKGAMRFEANVSVRPAGSQELGVRVEIKNLNSFRAMERAVAYEIERQIALIAQGGSVMQETLGWDDASGATFSQRSKEEAHDYRYFPEPDLPPLLVEPAWIEQIKARLPELPRARQLRFQSEYGLSPGDAHVLIAEHSVADYFEQAVAATGGELSARSVASWVSGELFAWMNQSGESLEQIKVRPTQLVELLQRHSRGEINLTTAKAVLAEMLRSGRAADEIIESDRLQQLSDAGAIGSLIRSTLEQYPAQVDSYLAGKITVANWFFGQVMRAAKGTPNPQVVRAELERQLAELRRR